MAVVDAHLHLFKAQSDQYPRDVFGEMTPPEREEPAEGFLDAMRAAGIDHAIIVPVSTPDHYLAEILRNFPGKFAGVGVYDPEASDGAGQVARRVETTGIQGLRHYGFGGEERQDPESLEVFPVLAAMRDHDLKVWFYGSPDQVMLLDGVMQLLPGLKVVLNHLGFCPDMFMELTIDDDRRPRFDISLPPASLALIEEMAAKHPEDLYIHFSGHYAFTGDTYPYMDLQTVSQHVYEAFGADRILMASDWPWIQVNPGHGETLAVLDHHLPDLSEGERAAIRGGNALSLFRF